jgi:ABC-type multidrug transport system fused ATPase/permease subunit
VKSQRRRVLFGALWGSTWMVSLMVPPYLISQAIDDGLRQGDMPVLAAWAAAILAVSGLSAVLGLLRHRTMTFARMDAAYRTVQVITRQAAKLGATLPRKVTSGEVATVGGADVGRISVTMTITGPGVGAVVAYAAVTVLLFSISPLLACVVLLGVPVLALVVGPLLRRLQHVESDYRDHLGELATRAGDIVSGLRVLSGLGGKPAFAQRYRAASASLREEGYKVGAVASWIQALAVGLPAVFLAAVVWLAARMAASGEITVGEMVGVYGYVAVLATPVFFFIEGADDLGFGLVAARRVVAMLSLTPEVEDHGMRSAGPAGPADMFDPESGLVVPAGGLLAIASGRPAHAAAVVDRLGRLVDSRASWGDVPLTDISLGELRRRVVVADNEADLFAGSVHDVVATHEDHDDEAFAAAVHAAAAADVLGCLRNGIDSHVEAQARNLSGGQRQRLRLVRALLTDADVLLLVEPTSAVDAHTEAVVAERVRAARAGRTTVVVSSSPLWLGMADRVAHLVDGEVIATGTHAELVATRPAYRAMVLRGDDPGASTQDDSLSAAGGGE